MLLFIYCTVRGQCSTVRTGPSPGVKRLERELLKHKRDKETYDDKNRQMARMQKEIQGTVKYIQWSYKNGLNRMRPGAPPLSTRLCDVCILFFAFLPFLRIFF